MVFSIESTGAGGVCFGGLYRCNKMKRKSLL